MYQTIRQFYNSKEWQRCRTSYTKKAKGLCERCLKKGIVQVGEEVHHKTRLTNENVNNPMISLNFDNLELLCKNCHHEEHDKVQGRRYRVDKKTGKVIDLE